MFDPSPSIYFYTMTTETNLRLLPLQSIVHYSTNELPQSCFVKYISNDAYWAFAETVRAKSS